MKAARVLPWARPHKTLKKETWNIASSAGTGMAVGRMVAGKKGAVLGAIAGALYRWVRWQKAR